MCEFQTFPVAMATVYNEYLQRWAPRERRDAVASSGETRWLACATVAALSRQHVLTVPGIVVSDNLLPESRHNMIDGCLLKSVWPNTETPHSFSSTEMTSFVAQK
jgi:hypothetical protein